MNRHTLTAYFAACVLVLTGCGDGDNPLTEEEFIAAADAICEETNREAAPHFEQIWSGLDGFDPGDPADEVLVFRRWVDALDDIEPLAREQLDELRDLVPPAADQDLIDDLLDDHEAALDDFVALMNEAANGDETAMATLESDDPVSVVEARLRNYGFEVCGADGA